MNATFKEDELQHPYQRGMYQKKKDDNNFMFALKAMMATHLTHVTVNERNVISSSRVEDVKTQRRNHNLSNIEKTVDMKNLSCKSLSFTNLNRVEVITSIFLAGIRMPVSPSIIASDVPPTFVAIIGLPAAIASIAVKPNASL